MTKHMAASASLVQRSISEHRKIHCLSALALAKQIGISSNQLSALERGEDTPSLYNLQRLAKFFRWDANSIGTYVLKCDATPTGPKRLRGNHP